MTHKTTSQLRDHKNEKQYEATSHIKYKYQANTRNLTEIPPWG